MAIGDRQLKILEVIDAGHTTGEAIVEVIGSSMQMLSYYMNQMVEDGYIKAARLYDNELQDFVVVRAYLTAEGEAILTQMGKRTAPQERTATPSVTTTPNPPTATRPAPNATIPSSTTATTSHTSPPNPAAAKVTTNASSSSQAAATIVL